MSCGVTTQRGSSCRRKQSPCFQHVNGPVPRRRGHRKVPGRREEREHSILTTTGRGAHKRALTNAEESRLIEFVEFLALPETDWRNEVERRFVARIDNRLVERLKRHGRERYLYAAADALDNPESALCRALENGLIGPMSPIERWLVEWIITNILIPGMMPGIDQFSQAAALLRILDIFIAANSGRELGIRVCTTKLLEQQRKVAIEFVIKATLDQAGL
jgi:hypothetical protein